MSDRSGESSRRYRPKKHGLSSLLLRWPGGVHVGFGAPIMAAETTEATVLFADMRGFTSLAERLAPTRVVPLLDEFFGVLSSATVAFRGEVFHIAGDGMMAGFGIRYSNGHGARDALASGHAMLKGFAPLATRWLEEFSVPTGIGVGLHLGDVALGLLGAPGKKAVTMVGDTVNVAARLCGRARAGEVLFSSTVAAALDADGAIPGAASGPIPYLQLPQFELRGRRGLLDIWCAPARERPAIRDHFSIV